MLTRVSSIQVTGIAAAVSHQWESLHDLSDEKPEIIDKFIKNTGVEGRYSASGRQTSSDFCFAAADALLTARSIDRNKIGVLVYVTQTSDYRIPATACVLQKRLGLGENLIAFDVNLGCSGFVYGLSICSSIMSTCSTKYGLLLAGDTSAREFMEGTKSKTGHSAAMLFGDSGTATLLERGDADNTLAFAQNTDGNGYQAIFAPYGSWRNPQAPPGMFTNSTMKDIDVFTFATNRVPVQINDYMAELGTRPEDYDCLILHQANLMILKRITKKTGFPPEKMLLSMNQFGNTSSASIPITLVHHYGDMTKGQVNALCCGFGVGLSWATVALKLNIPDILPLVHTDEYFVDGYNLNDRKEKAATDA
ncbi:MAG: ketoacyl-ACP synthase III [Blautia sp.]|nr:ketoacyl-ACP synthase III [Blautia sp.]